MIIISSHWMDFNERKKKPRAFRKAIQFPETLLIGNDIQFLLIYYYQRQHKHKHTNGLTSDSSNQSRFHLKIVFALPPLNQLNCVVLYRICFLLTNWRESLVFRTLFSQISRFKCLFTLIFLCKTEMHKVVCVFCIIHWPFSLILNSFENRT